MKLTIEQLSLYHLHGLKGIDQYSGEIVELYGINLGEENPITLRRKPQYPDNTRRVDEFKPYFHPLSDLANSMKIAGKGKIPLLELYKVSQSIQITPEYDYIATDKDSHTLMHKGTGYFWFNYHNMSFHGVNRPPNQWAMFQWLFKHHFWIHDQKYFDEGLIIDIKTLKQST